MSNLASTFSCLSTIHITPLIQHVWEEVENKSQKPFANLGNYTKTFFQVLTRRRGAEMEIRLVLFCKILPFVGPEYEIGMAMRLYLPMPIEAHMGQFLHDGKKWRFRVIFCC